MHIRDGRFVVGLVALALVGCGSMQRGYLSPDALPDRWRTLAERTNYAETGRYAEVVDFCQRLAQHAPQARFQSFGLSGEGRPLPLLILSSERAFTPEAARGSDRPLILIQNCIHPGECMGKDASLALARDILVTGTRADLLEGVNILIMPIFNVDGHERFGPHNRINQLGPKETGWRTTAVNLNLNRDYTKTDAVEMQAWLRLWNAWQPDLLIDNHSTDGMDHRYDVLYAATTTQLAAEPIAAWAQHVLLPGILEPLAADGYETLPYAWPRDRRDLSEGIVVAQGFGPRYSTGYGAVCNRPAVLVEAHSRKPYKRRVRVTYALLVHTLETLNRDQGELHHAIAEADQQCTACQGGEQDGRVPMRIESNGHSYRFTFKAYEQKLRPSEITGDTIIEYTRTPLDVDTLLYDEPRVAGDVAPAAAYLIPPQWSDVIRRLDLHGVRFFRLDRRESLDVASYRFEDVEFRANPYEGRQIPSYKAVPTRERREYPRGTVVVPLDQPRAKLAAHLLEPDAPDSLIAWGLFNAVFEQKEYAEAYVMEPIAQQMAAADPQLHREFEQKLADDAEFAKKPGARLNFFYRRSPYHDAAQNRYPVARLTDVAALQRLRGE